MSTSALPRHPRQAAVRPDPWDAPQLTPPNNDLTASKLMNFRVEIDLFRGPLDLLLYLVRKQELDVSQLPLARITDQFVDYLEVLVVLDFDAVGEFLELASVLLELKARSLLPQSDEQADELEEQRDELVQRLLEYKQYKDAAALLQQRGQQWQLCYSRLGHDLPGRNVEPVDQAIQEVEVWDLVSAFGRIMRDARLMEAPPTIIYDETPIQVYMQQIHDLLAQYERISFASIFQPGLHKSAMIGMFLAVLELARHHDVAVEQDRLHAEIWVVRGQDFQPEFQVTDTAAAPTAAPTPAATATATAAPAAAKPR